MCGLIAVKMRQNGIKAFRFFIFLLANMHLSGLRCISRSHSQFTGSYFPQTTLWIYYLETQIYKSKSGREEQEADQAVCLYCSLIRDDPHAMSL